MTKFEELLLQPVMDIITVRIHTSSFWEKGGEPLTCNMDNYILLVGNIFCCYIGIQICVEACI